MVQLSRLLEKGRTSRKTLLFLVFIALFLDNMILTTVVPIMPEYLFRLKHPNETGFAWSSQRSAPKPMRNSTINPVPPRNNRSTIKTMITRYKIGGDYENIDVIDQNELVRSTANATSSNPDDERKEERESITEENIWVGLMFGSKALVQLITNPFVGPLTDRFGYTIPMFSGFVIMFISTIVFAFGQSYIVLFFARTVQGIGSACTSSSGMGMLAQAYPDDSERGGAMGISLGGLALGVLIGAPFGGVLFKFSGKELPFVILALLALFGAALQLVVLQPKLEKCEKEGSSLKTLIKDPYINIALGALIIGNLGIAMLEPTLQLWMMDTMAASSATRGVAVLPSSISYLVGANIFGRLAYRIGHWLTATLSLIIIGGCLISIPSAKSVYGLIAPIGLQGFALGMIDVSMFSQVGHLVDLRHVGVYGSIYAIADAAFCFAFALGPFFSGPIVKWLGFPAMLYIIAVVNFVYAPLLLLLRNPPAMSSEEKPLLANGDAEQFRH